MRLLGVVLLAGALSAQTLATRIDRILQSSPAARHAVWGIRVVNVETGATVYSRNEDQLFVPASNAKLFSTALALMRLGPEHRFPTAITSPAKPDAEGRVAELRFVGGGSPNLSGRLVPYQSENPKNNPLDPLRYVEQFAQQLVDGGLRRVDGDIIADTSAYADQPYPDGWALDDPVYDYGAPVTALFINDAMVRVRVSADMPPRVEVSPPMPGLAIHNRVTTGSSTKLTFSRLPGSSELTISGTVAGEAEGELGMENPPLYAAEALSNALQKRGVQIGGSARVEAFPAPGVELVVHESERLAETLTIVNKESLNLQAEILLLETARVRTGAPGTRKAAFAEMDAFLEEIGITAGSYNLRDGSGLSRHTLLSPAAITKLLVYMHNTPYREQWKATLPIGGVDGTLKERFVGSAGGHQILAKTGSMTHVNALSGYAGSRYAFSILVNNSNQPARAVRRVMDRVALALVEPAVRSRNTPRSNIGTTPKRSAGVSH